MFCVNMCLTYNWCLQKFVRNFLTAKSRFWRQNQDFRVKIKFFIILTSKIKFFTSKSSFLRQNHHFHIKISIVMPKATFWRQNQYFDVKIKVFDVKIKFFASKSSYLRQSHHSHIKSSISTSKSSFFIKIWLFTSIHPSARAWTCFI